MPRATGPRINTWSEEKMISSDGYVKLRVGKDHPLADPNGYAYEHLVIWVSAGNPRPPKGWLLHHRNEHKTDNRISNLELKLKPDHGVLHAGKLTDEQVVDLRASYARGEADCPGLADRFGIPPQSAWKIIRGIVRRSAGGEIQTGSLRSRRYNK